MEQNIEIPKERIDSTDWKFMVSTAFLADLIQGTVAILPLAGPFIVSFVLNPLIFLVFWLWLKLHGVSITDSIERIALMFGGFLLEMIPILDILPIWTLTIGITILLVRTKDLKKINTFYLENPSIKNSN